MILETLVVRLDGTVSGFDEALSDADRRLTRFGSKLQGIGTRLTLGVSVPLTAIAGLGIRSAQQLETFSTSLRVLIGDADRANATFDDLYEFSARSPFSWKDLSDGTRLLAAFGVEAEAIVPTLRRIGDISSGTNNNIAEMAELYGKARVQGRLFQEDINQLTGRGVPIIQELAKQFGVAESEVRGLVSSGQVNFGHLEEAFRSLTAEGGKFFGLTAEMAETSAGRWNQLKDTGEQVLDIIGERLLPMFDATVTTLQGVVEGFVNLNSGAQTTIIVLAGLAAAIGPASLALGTVVKLLPTLRLGLLALGTVSAGPIGLLILAVGGLAAAWGSVASKAREARQAQADAIKEWKASLASMSPEELAEQEAEALRKRNAAQRKINELRATDMSRLNQRQREAINARIAELGREVSHYQSAYIQILAAQRQGTQATEEQTTATVAYGRAVEDTAGNITRLLERQESLRESIAETKFEEAFVTTRDEAEKLTAELVAMQAELAKVEASLSRIAQGRMGGLPGVTPGVQTSLPLTPLGGTVRLSRGEQERFRQTQRLPGVTDWRQELIDAADEAQVASERMRIGVVSNFGAMAEAAIWGGQQMEVSIIRGITNIVAAIPGVGGFAGAVIGTVGGIIGGLFGRRPQPVKVPEMPKAVKELEKINASLRNVPIEWVNLMRHQLARTLTPPVTATPQPPRERPERPSLNISGPINVYSAPGDSPRQTWERFRAGLRQAAAGGDPDARELLGTA